MRIHSNEIADDHDPPVGAFFDFKNAYGSIDADWLFIALEASRMDEGAIMIFASSYVNTALFSPGDNGILCPMFIVTTGIIAIGIFCLVRRPPRLTPRRPNPPRVRQQAIHRTRPQVIGVALLGFWAYHMYLVWCGKTTNETFKWEDLQYDMQEAYHKKHGLDRKKSVKVRSEHA